MLYVWGYASFSVSYRCHLQILQASASSESGVSSEHCVLSIAVHLQLKLQCENSVHI